MRFVAKRVFEERNNFGSKLLNDATSRLGEGKILPLVFKLTIPAVIAQLITFLYNIVDRMFVAKIQDSYIFMIYFLSAVIGSCALSLKTTKFKVESGWCWE